MRLTPDEARERLGAARVARLATVSATGQPHLVPVTFAVDGDMIYIAVDHKPKTTTKLRRLANIAIVWFRAGQREPKKKKTPPLPKLKRA